MAPPTTIDGIADHAHGHAYEHGHDHPHGWRRWLYAAHHQDIGTLYMWFSLTMLMAFGAIMSAFVGFDDRKVPLQIVVSDMAFARLPSTLLNIRRSSDKGMTEGRAW